MLKHKTVQTVTPGQVKELASALVESLPVDLSADRAQYWIGKKSKLSHEIRKVLVEETTRSRVEYAPLVLEQVQFYKEVMDREIHPDWIKLPSEHNGFGWILHMLDELTPMQIWAVLEKKMPSWKYWGNLDEIVSDRDSRKGGYTICLRDRIEADEELANKSAYDLKREGISGITFPERALLEVFYNWKTGGGHLDVRNITLCSGSRSPDGRVPGACWDEGGFDMYWYSPQDSFSDLRSRVVIS